MNHDPLRPSSPNSSAAPGSWRGRAAQWRGWAKRRRRLVVSLLVLVAVLAGVAYALRPSPQQNVRGGRFAGGGPMPVNVATAEKGDVPIVVNALGTVTPLSTVTVRPQVSGYITEIAFQEGQMVEQGEVLAIVDPRPYELALQQAQGQLERDQALLRNAETDAARYQALFEQDSIARQQVDTQNALVRQYRGVVQADKAAVDTAKLNLSYCYIKAPLTGRVGLRQVDQGNYVTTGDTRGVAVITQVKPISVLFTVPEDQLQRILKRMREGPPLPVTALDRSQKERLATGELTTIDNQIDPATGTVKLRATFANDDERLFPNQFVNIELLVDTEQDATVVPVAAIQRGAPGTFVYVVDSESKVAVRPVTLGAATGERVAVATGLKPQEVVVTDGADRIRDGAYVLLPGQEPPARGTRSGQRARGEGARGDRGSGRPAQRPSGERGERPQR